MKCVLNIMLNKFVKITKHPESSHTCHKKTLDLPSARIIICSSKQTRGICVTPSVMIEIKCLTSSVCVCVCQISMTSLASAVSGR